MSVRPLDETVPSDSLSTTTVVSTTSTVLPSCPHVCEHRFEGIAKLFVILAGYYPVRLQKARVQSSCSDPDERYPV